MIKSDSLDNITLDSDDIRTIERFENNYYNSKNNIIQNGGGGGLEKIKVGPIEIPEADLAALRPSSSLPPQLPPRPSQEKKNLSGGNNKRDKLEKNIKRLYNCYILSQNLNGGDNNNELSFQIKKRLDNKIAQLSKELEGGIAVETVTVVITAAMIEAINTAVIKHTISQINNIINENTTKTIVNNLIGTMDIKNIVIDTISTYTKDTISNLCDNLVSGASCMFSPGNNLAKLKNIQMEFNPKQNIPNVIGRRG
jgi:hypothetical protein